MPVAFVGPALQGASLIGRFGVPLLQQAGLAAGLAGIGAAAGALTNKSQTKPQLTGRTKLSQTWGKIPSDLNSPQGGGFGYAKGRQPSYMDAQGNTYDAVSGRLLYPARKVDQPAVITPAGTVQPGSIVSGLTPAGTVDRSQSDEYKSQMSQYQNLIKQQKQAEAEDLGMKIFMEKYAKSPIAQAGGAIGAYNPLLAATFPETKGFTGTFAPVEEYEMGDLGTRAQGELGPTMETLNPLASQAAQQEATATQADMATTAGLSAGDRARNLTRAFRLGLI
jgi:hypothetical protein